MGSTTTTQVPTNVFRIMLDEQTMLPNNRSVGAESFVEFAELPENLTFTKTAIYNEDHVLGRSEPYITYANSTATTFVFEAKLVATGSPKDRSIFTEVIAGALGLTGRFVSGASSVIGPAGTVISNADQASIKRFEKGTTAEAVVSATYQEVTRKVAWLEALLYPQYDDQGTTYAPPMVNLMYGQNLLRHGVITNISFTLKGPWELTTLLCMVVGCNVQFTEVNKVPKGYLNVRNLQPPKPQIDSTTGFKPRKVIDNVRSQSGL